MRGKSRAGRLLTTATLLLYSLSISGCGFIFSHAPPDGHEQMTSFSCTSDNTPATLDIVWGSLNLIGALAAAANPDAYVNPDQIVAVGLSWTAISTASAVTGFGRSKRCRDAQMQLAVRQGAARAAQAPTVQAGEPVAVEIDPPTDTLRVGELAQLGVKARGSDGLLIFGRSYVWSSSNDAVASVNAAGTVAAHAVGTVVIAARTGSVTGTAHIAVLQ